MTTIPEYGFYHPDHGYWQSVGGVLDELMAKAPEGTVQVPVKPGADYEWDADSGEWVYAPVEQEPEPPTLADAIAAKLAELDDYRWQQEVGGAAFAGMMIRTDWNSQAKITAAYTMARLDPGYSIPTWEVVPGVFMPLDNATIVAMGEAVRDHVQDTFNRKAVLHSQIAALETIDAVLAYDIPTEWNKG